MPPALHKPGKDFSDSLAASATAENDWQRLFNGEDFSAWNEEDGDPNFTPKTVPSSALSNTLLVTDETYNNFVLERGFKIDAAISTGVQIRSTSYEKDITEP